MVTLHILVQIHYLFPLLLVLLLLGNVGDIWASVQISWNTFPTPMVSCVALSQLISWNYFHKFVSPTKIYLQNFILSAISRSNWLFKNVHWVSALFCCISSQHSRDAKNLDTTPLTQTIGTFADHCSSAHPSSDWNVSNTDNTSTSQPTHDPSQTRINSISKWATGQKLLI